MNTATAEKPLTAIAEYSATAAALADLGERYRGIVFQELATTKGMDVAKKARAELRTLRVDLEAKRVEIKAPALAHCKLIDDEAKRITTELRALEEPIDQQIKREEERKEAEKAAKAQAERERLDKIQAGIDEIKQFAVDAAGKPAATIAVAMDLLEQYVIDEKFAEFKDVALQQKVHIMNKLNQMHAAAVEQEAEAARIKAEREQLERDKAEQLAREQAQRKLIEEGQRRRMEEERLARAKLEADQRASREKIEREEREARQRQEESERQARAVREAEEARLKQVRDAEDAERKRVLEEQEEKLRAERAKLEKERLAKEARDKAAQDKKDAAEKVKRDKAEAAERERLRIEAEKQDARAMLNTFLQRFRHDTEFAKVVKAIDEFFRE